MAELKKRKIALVIGNSDYYPLDELKNPVNDSNAMADALKKLEFELHEYINLDKESFDLAIKDFGTSICDYDIRVIYFSGHGFQYAGTNYLVPTDAKLTTEASIEKSCIKLQTILDYLQIEHKGINIIILDACRENPFEATVATQGFMPIDAPPDTLIAFSTSPGNIADDGENENGLYTESLLSQICKPNLTLTKMFQLARRIVKEKSEGNQIPWESTSLTEELYLSTGNSLPISHLEVKQINNFRRLTDASMYQFSKITQDVFGKSTEGGKVDIYYLDKDVHKIEATFYGEMGQAVYQYYFNDNKLCFCSVMEIRYNRPVYWGEEHCKEFNDHEQFDFSKSNFTENLYYFKDGNLIAAINEKNDFFEDQEDRVKVIIEESEEYLQMAFDILK